jgi:hypothetical protein
MPLPKISNAEKFSDPDNINNEYGFNNSACYKPDLHYAYAASEDVWNKDNSWIVFGRDRPGNYSSGYGAQGDPYCDRIEICVGRMSGMDPEDIDGVVHPNNGRDAAKIYISQKTDIDKNFFINCRYTPPSVARSAVAIKADDIRIISRNSMKLVTNTDQTLANTVNSYSALGIQIIANNDDRDMQSMVKGENLVNALLELEKKIIAIASTLNNFMNVQREYNIRVGKHTHHGSINVNSLLETSVSPQILISEKDMVMGLLQNVEANLRLDINNIKSWSSEYLNPAKSDTYINSLYNKVN